MKFVKRIVSIFTVVCVCATCFLLSAYISNKGAYVSNKGADTKSVNQITADNFLLKTGMPEKTVDKLDSDIKAFMVADMEKSKLSASFNYVSLKDDSLIGASMLKGTFRNIKFSASAFKSGSTIYIYPTYEFTACEKPAGNDSFSFQLGDAMRPYEAGGKLWYTDDTMSKWLVTGDLTANYMSLDVIEFSGRQLGTPDWDMKLKGCTYCHATVGSGDDKRICLNYMYNPYGGDYSISYSASNRIYTAAKMITLSY